MRIFDIDGPVVQFLNKAADLMWLNILTMICCIPVFTAGASFTAMHYMALKIVRDEECYITRGFFHSFKENFRQSTILWLIMLLVAAILGIDFYIIEKSGLEFNKILKIAILALAAIAAFTATMVFPLQAKFANPIKATLKNAFVVGIMQLPETVVMLVLLSFPIVLCLITWRLIPVAFAFGLSLPAYISALLYNKTFKKMEKQFLDAGGQEQELESEEDERIFKDEADESIVVDEN